MKTRNLLSTLFASFMLTVNLSAQQPTFEWAKQISGPASESGSALAMDNLGNIYTIGSFYETVDFDPSAVTFNLTSNGASDIFITKIDALGNFLWAKQIGGIYYDEPGDIVVDDNGNILIGGSFRETVDMDPGAGIVDVTAIGTESFLLKLDSNGDFMWAKHWGGNNSSAMNYISTIALDSSGNIIIGGSFKGNNDLDPGEGTYNVTSSGEGDAYISKLSSSGEFLWAVAFGANNSNYADRVNSLAVDGSGNIIASGPFFGTIAPLILQDGGNFYIKLDASGNLIWSKQTDGFEDVITNSLKLDEAGNSYMVGRFGGTRDFDPGPEVFNITCSSGYYDIFILKLDASGNFVWAKGFGGGASLGADSGNSIVLDNQGYLYTTGSYVGAGDFNPGTGEYILTPIGFVDMFISKLDTDGNFVYATTFGSIPDGFTNGQSLIADDSGNVYCTGYFQNTTDFDPGSGVFNLVSDGGDDIFLLKLSQTTVGISENTFTENIQVYPNPTHGNFAIKFETRHKSLSVRIMSISGQTIETRTFKNTDFVQLKLGQPKGIYILETVDEQWNKSRAKLIKH